MSSEYRVSALVSIYRAERFMRGRLEDLLAQSLHERGELEILVLDSASPEGEREIVEEFQALSPHIRYMRSEHRESLYAAWNRIVEQASAPLLANANADDRYRPDALEVLADALEENTKAGFAYGDAYLSREENERFADHEKSNIAYAQDYCGPALLCHHFLGHQIMWRRSLHDGIGPFNASYRAAGDCDFFLRAASTAQGLHVQEPLGLMLQRSDSITFSDATMAQEKAQVFSVYRTKEYALKLYAAVGLDVGNDRIACACLLDLGNRAMAFYPQWRNGRIDMDFAFAKNCYEWASATANSPDLRELCAASLETLALVSGEADFSKERRVHLLWPDFGLAEPSSGMPHARHFSGSNSAASLQAGRIAWKRESFRVDDYWSASLGLTKSFLKQAERAVREGRKLGIWGAGHRGKLWIALMRSHGLKVDFALDSNPAEQGRILGEVQILPAKALPTMGTCVVILALGELHWDSVVATVKELDCAESCCLLRP